MEDDLGVTGQLVSPPSLGRGWKNFFWMPSPSNWKKRSLSGVINVDSQGLPNWLPGRAEDAVYLDFSKAFDSVSLAFFWRSWQPCLGQINSFLSKELSGWWGPESGGGRC